MTAAAQEALASATDVFGYETYLQRLTLRPGQRLHESGNRAEIERAEAALGAAYQGQQVVLVSGGDPGVFAMAAAVYEAIERGPKEWRSLDVIVEPGITAMLAAAARVGAPLGHDFCAISLSDNLKPWTIIERRLRLASEADFVIALYNPASVARPDGIRRAFAILREAKAEVTPVVIARAIGRDNESVQVTALGAADLSAVDMQTLIIVGSSATRVLARDDSRSPWVYTPRSVELP
jgi:precorrin-3B C17-methyltransferase